MSTNFKQGEHICFHGLCQLECVYLAWPFFCLVSGNESPCKSLIGQRQEQHSHPSK